MTPRLPLPSVCALSAALLLQGGASAQPQPDTTTADALFEQGRKLIKSGAVAEACQKFEQSQKLDPAVGTLLHLADCYERLGKLATAWSTFRDAAAAARAEAKPDRERKAQSRADALEKRLIKLIVRVPTASERPGLVIRRDGATVAQTLWNTAFPVDPGPTSLEASAPGYRPWTAKLTLTEEGTTHTLPLPPLEPEAAPAPPASSASSPPLPPPPSAAPGPSAALGTSAAPEPSPRVDRPRGSMQRSAALVLGGVGAVGVGVGAVFGVRAFVRWAQTLDECNDEYQCTDLGLERARQAREAANLSTILVLAGGVGVGVGAALWFTAPTTSLSVAPAQGGASLSLRHQF